MAKKSGDEDEAITPDVLPPPTPTGSAADRNRAYRIGKTIKEGGTPTAEDLEWYTDYNKAKQTRTAQRSKKVTFTSEEQESAAQGDPATMAAILAAPQLAKEEGRRIDSLIREATNATTNANKMTIMACEMVMKFAVAILDRNGKLEQNNIGMLDTFRKSHIEMTHATAALVQQQAEHEADAIMREAEDKANENEGGGDMVEGIIQQFLPVIVAEMQKRAVSGKKGDE